MILSRLMLFVDTDKSDFLKQIPDPKSCIPEHPLIDKLERAMKGLTRNQRKVIILTYGFEDGICLTLKEIGAILNLSESRICQIHSSAVEILGELLSPYISNFEKVVV